MLFELTAPSDEHFIEILDAGVDSPCPKTVEQRFALRDRFSWVPSPKGRLCSHRMFVLVSFPLTSLSAMASLSH